jgi:DNA processing protein
MTADEQPIGADESGAVDEPSEREAWAILLSVHGLGPAGFGALLAAHGTARALLAAAARSGAAARFARIAAEVDGRPIFGREVGEGIVNAAAGRADLLPVLRGSDVRIVTLDDADYPARLRAIELPPPVLFCRGSVEALAARHTVAIVGTRRPTERGRLAAARIAGAVSRAGAVVVSGLAVGIDGAAHAAAVAERWPTIAVLGSGHRRLFPRAHLRLADEIVDGRGAVVSELWPDQRPSANTFPQRNRVISGLADATIVIEAGERSGALITAKWALEQARPLFLVPGPLDEPRSVGCLLWLREYPGEARIVARVPELIADLGLLQAADASPGRNAARAAGRPSLEAILVEVGPTARDVGAALVDGHGTLDELVAITDLAPATVLGAITLLELRGLATSTYGRYRPAGQLASAPLGRATRRRAAQLPGRAGAC